VLQKLLDLKPQTAVLLTIDEEGQVTDERTIPVEQLQAGDVLKVGGVVVVLLLSVFTLAWPQLTRRACLLLWEPDTFSELYDIVTRA
jgi:cation transport ATPase